MYIHQTELKTSKKFIFTATSEVYLRHVKLFSSRLSTKSSWVCYKLSRKQPNGLCLHLLQWFKLEQIWIQVASVHTDGDFKSISKFLMGN